MSPVRGQPLCQVASCRQRSCRAVEIDLPASWDGAREYTALTVTVGLCREHGSEVSRRTEALLQARSDHGALLAVIEMAAVEDLTARQATEALERALAEAEGAVAYQRDRAERAEAALQRAGQDGGQVA